MPQLQLSHFECCVLFALLTSTVLGVVTKRTDRERLMYAVRCFAYFMATVFGLMLADVSRTRLTEIETWNQPPQSCGKDFTISFASRIKAWTCALDSFPQLRTGVVSPPNSIVVALPNETLLKHLGRGRADSGCADSRSE